MESKADSYISKESGLDNSDVDMQMPTIIEKNLADISILSQESVADTNKSILLDVTKPLMETNVSMIETISKQDNLNATNITKNDVTVVQNTSLNVSSKIDVEKTMGEVEILKEFNSETEIIETCKTADTSIASLKNESIKDDELITNVLMLDENTLLIAENEMPSNSMARKSIANDETHFFPDKSSGIDDSTIFDESNSATNEISIADNLSKSISIKNAEADSTTLNKESEAIDDDVNKPDDVLVMATQNMFATNNEQNDDSFVIPMTQEPDCSMFSQSGIQLTETILELNATIETDGQRKTEQCDKSIVEDDIELKTNITSEEKDMSTNEFGRFLLLERLF